MILRPRHLFMLYIKIPRYIMFVIKKIRLLFLKVVGFFLADILANKVCLKSAAAEFNQFELIFTSILYE